MKATGATPILRIFDEAKAREFYIDWLGFTVDFEHRFEPGTPLYMGISLGECKLHLSEHHGDGSPGAHVRINITDGLAAYQQALLAKNYKYYRPGLEETEWKTREMTVQDGFGNKLVFSEPR
jgi:catechol 2,3-dioxygenase-like lactoylglutathione lyase family enzyme